MKTRTRRLFAAFAFLLTLTGCSRPTSWNEEVQLRSGEVLNIRRTIQFKEYQPWGSGGGGSDIPMSELEFVSPVRADNPTKWTQPSLLPMVLDRDPQTKEWFIVATFLMCNTWRELGRPELPYAEFRYRNNLWMRVSLSQKLLGEEANVLIPNQGDLGRDQTLTTKRSLMSRPDIAPEYVRVVNAWKTNC